MRGEAISRKVGERLQTSLKKSPSEMNFCRDVCNRLLILDSRGVPPMVSPKVLHTSNEKASFCKGI